MDQQAAFLNFISNQHSIDNWSDVAIEKAIELANAMSPTEWRALKTDWERLTPLCQTRLAEVASEVSIQTPSVAEILVSMLSSNNSEVVEASLDSLNSICERLPECLERLDIGTALANVVPGGKCCVIVLESLKRKVSHKS
ncbi:MAG: hypothetical protein WCH39_15415 [Schlesneria sp.]|jgi:hypothetical protein